MAERRSCIRTHSQARMVNEETHVRLMNGENQLAQITIMLAKLSKQMKTLTVLPVFDVVPLSSTSFESSLNDYAKNGLIRETSLGTPAIVDFLHVPKGEVVLAKEKGSALTKF